MNNRWAGRDVHVQPGSVFPPDYWWDPNGVRFIVDPAAEDSLLVGLEEKLARLEQTDIPPESLLRGRISDMLSAALLLYVQLRGDWTQPNYSNNFALRLGQWGFRVIELARKYNTNSDHIVWSALTQKEAGLQWDVGILPANTATAAAGATPLVFPIVCPDRDNIPWAQCAQCGKTLRMRAKKPLTLRCNCAPNTGRPAMAPWNACIDSEPLFVHPYGTAPRQNDTALLAEYEARREATQEVL